MKKYVVFILLFCLVLPLNAIGAEFPHKIWKPLDEYVIAKESQNYHDLIRLGKEVLGIMEAEPESDLRTEFLADKYCVVAESAEKLGQYDLAVEYFKKYIPFATKAGWWEGVILAERKIVLLQTHLDIFIEEEGYAPVYYGAKFEPVSGTLFGSVYAKDKRPEDYTPEAMVKKNSTYLMYFDFGEEISELPWLTYNLEDARKDDMSVELAWNTNNSVPDLENQKEYIRRTIDAIDNCGVPIFLRFACEMNIGPSGVDSEQFVEAFRYVAAYAKQKKNIAVVWSPNNLGALDRPFEMYYPGDEYVDWIGVSLYPMRYFTGKKDHGDMTDALNAFFMSDYFANPTLGMKPIFDFMEQNNIQKPVMLSECGVPHYLRTTDEDITHWGSKQLERMYGELIRVYPSIKHICYFDVSIANEVQEYSLYKSDFITQTYKKMIQNPYFLSNLNESSSFGYKPFDGGSFPSNKKIALSAFAYYPKEFYNEVRYFVDGNLIHATGNPPYNFDFNSSDFGVGNHSLTVELYAFDNKLMEKTIPFNIIDDIKVIVNSNQIEFYDQQPVIIDGSTLVPARGVFEALGMEVSWIASENKVLLNNSEYEVFMQINNKTLTINQNGNITTEEMPVPAQLINGRTMIPVRAIAQAINAKVNWIGETKTVTVDK